MSPRLVIRRGHHAVTHPDHHRWFPAGAPSAVGNPRPCPEPQWAAPSPSATTARFSLWPVILGLTLTLFCSAPATAATKRLIVTFKTTDSSRHQEVVRRHRGRIHRRLALIRGLVVTVTNSEVTALARDPQVASLEEDQVVRAVDGASDAEYQTAWGVARIGSRELHQQGITGSGVRLAVIDTGIDYTHPELAAAYSGGYDVIFDDPDPYDDSWNSHGTHIAGIIAAAGDGTGVVGVAPDADLYAVKVLDGAGFGSTSTVIAGIDWAVANHMDVANLSLELPDYSPALEAACEQAAAAGVLLVAAGGNTYSGEVRYPARFPSVLAVTATDETDTAILAAPLGPEVELAAPGAAIVSTVAGGGYAPLTGTSQAAAHVSGGIALLLSSGLLADANDDGVVDGEDARLRLAATAVDLGDAGVDDRYGAGRMDLAAALPAEPAPWIEVRRAAYHRRSRTLQVTALSDSLVPLTLTYCDQTYEMASRRGHGLFAIRLRPVPACTSVALEAGATTVVAPVRAKGVRRRTVKR